MLTENFTEEKKNRLEELYQHFYGASSLYMYRNGQSFRNEVKNIYNSIGIYSSADLLKPGRLLRFYMFSSNLYKGDTTNEFGFDNVIPHSYRAEVIFITNIEEKQQHNMLVTTFLLHGKKYKTLVLNGFDYLLLLQ